MLPAMRRAPPGTAHGEGCPHHFVLSVTSSFEGGLGGSSLVTARSCLQSGASSVGGETLAAGGALTGDAAHQRGRLSFQASPACYSVPARKWRGAAS